MAVTINVNSLNAVKWKKIKISLNADTNVIALQETHCDVQKARDTEIHWKKNWIAYWGFSTNGRGVAILVKRDTYTTVEELLLCNRNMVEILIKDIQGITQQW